MHLQGVPAPGPYWIFGLGPETYGPDGLYQWAVVSSELQIDLFVLARNVSDFYSTWHGGIDGYLKQNGWDKVREGRGAGEGGGVCVGGGGRMEDLLRTVAGR